MEFKLHSKFKPTGDQPEAIEKLVDGFKKGEQFQTLLGVTGSGKTFTMANVIEQIQKPTLIIAHNKTLAAQLYGEFKEFFPENAVEYFVSYYDYYQPEAYVPSTDTYIEKDSSINDEIEMVYDRGDAIRKLVEIQYDRNDMDFTRGTFRVRGENLEIYPASYGDSAIRVEYFDDEIDRIVEFDVLTGEVKRELEHAAIFPNSHYVTAPDKLERAIKAIEEELKEQVAYFKSEDKLIEAQRIAERTNFDITPHTLIEYFGDDFLIIIDESHMTIPQIRGMYNGDQARKSNLVEYGFRLPSAKDNRPLKFEEFESMIDQMMFVSATPGEYEAEHELDRAEQILRPTGLLDPEIEVHPIEGQIDHLIAAINRETEKGNKVLVTTLTKKMAEDLTDYMKEVGIRVRYLHSDIDTLERTEIVRDMRLDVFDVLVGINLLREGLDIPEISLVAILDADKEGFLRSETSLIQTVGRAARNSEGHVIMYADEITDSMKNAIDETNRRRALQMKYNEEHGITPETIQKEVRDLISISKQVDKQINDIEKDPESMDRKEIEELINKVKRRMDQAAADLDFETAIEMRDRLTTLKTELEKMD